MLESRVRKFIKQQFGDDATWIEQTRGSTIGFPDCLLNIELPPEVPFPRYMFVPAELKRADIQGGQILNKATELFRPEQLGHIFRMFRKNMLSLVIFGQRDPELPEEFAISDNFKIAREIMRNKPLSCKKIKEKQDIVGYSLTLIT